MTELKIILDRSGSIWPIKSSMEEALNSYIAQQASEPGDLYVSLYEFNTVYQKVFERKPAKAVEPITIIPTGGTALYDAIGFTINPIQKTKFVREEQVGYVNPFGKFATYKVGARDSAVYRKVETGEDIIVVIITDGEENSSRSWGNQWNPEPIKNLIGQKKELGVNFVFLGANQDAVLSAKTIGIGYDHAITYAASANGIKGMSASLGQYTNSLRSTGYAVFTNANRSESMAG